MLRLKLCSRPNAAGKLQNSLDIQSTATSCTAVVILLVACVCNVTDTSRVQGRHMDPFKDKISKVMIQIENRIREVSSEY